MNKLTPLLIFHNINTISVDIYFLFCTLQHVNAIRTQDAAGSTWNCTSSLVAVLVGCVSAVGTTRPADSAITARKDSTATQPNHCHIAKFARLASVIRLERLVERAIKRLDSVRARME